MLTIQWTVKLFHQLTVDQLFEVFQLRVNVFVVEQKCAYTELDDFDRHPGTSHLTGCDEAGQLIAYARLLSPGTRYPEANIGRFVVRKEIRGQGVGHQLLDVALNELRDCWPGSAVRISAQDYLKKFYAQYGFARVSDVYLEDGIPHIEMVKET